MTSPCSRSAAELRSIPVPKVPAAFCLTGAQQKLLPGVFLFSGFQTVLEKTCEIVGHDPLAGIVRDEVVANLDHYIAQAVRNPVQDQRMGNAVLGAVRHVAFGSV